MVKAPTPLRLAIVYSGLRQIEISKRTGIQVSRLSMIVNGHFEATPPEQKALARLLRKPVEELFPEVAA
jgi:transcriptional regulator with XRE-family HTH domain